jgi:hypothetical protein
MYSRFQHNAPKLLPMVVLAVLFVSAGPASLLRTVAETSRLLGQISLDLCQMGIVALRVFGI